MTVSRLAVLSGIGPLELPVSLPVGLALLGRREGETFPLSEPQGVRTVQLRQVLAQSEAAWPDRFCSA